VYPLAPNKVLSIKELGAFLDITKDILAVATFRRQSKQVPETAKEEQTPRGAYGEREGSSHRRGRQGRSACSTSPPGWLKRKLSVKA
jgi:hypothetical protein